jgi:hypothetical protein
MNATQFSDYKWQGHTPVEAREFILDRQFGVMPVFLRGGFKYCPVGSDFPDDDCVHTDIKDHRAWDGFYCNKADCFRKPIIICSVLSPDCVDKLIEWGENNQVPVYSLTILKLKNFHPLQSTPGVA